MNWVVTISEDALSLGVDAFMDCAHDYDCGSISSRDAVVAVLKAVLGAAIVIDADDGGEAEAA